MVFSDASFLFVALPGLAILFYPRILFSQRALILVVFSLLFYEVGGGVTHVFVLTVNTAWVYFITRSNKIVQNRILLISAILVPALALFYFKYAEFFASSFLPQDIIETPKINSLFSDVFLPPGISFYTFQLISYSIDRYRGQVAADSRPKFIKFLLYISFFPQLIAGPIVRFNQIQSYLRRVENFNLTNEIILQAVAYFTIGLALKLLLADGLGRIIEPLTANYGHLSPGVGFFMLFAFGFQIYFDFYGYSLMAIGLGRLFGIELPQNFNRPYEALNPKDFWRRWHITLSFWIRDYIYLPLGGNRKYIRNILIVFALVGLWHGAAWNFVVWGIYHATLVILYHMTSSVWDRLPAKVQICLNYLLVTFGWAFFFIDLENIPIFFQSLIGLGQFSDLTITLSMIVTLGASAAVCFMFNTEQIVENQTNSKRVDAVKSLCLATLLFVCIMFVDPNPTFIYFQF